MSEDYSDPYENYKRLVSTILFLQSGASPHPNFFNIHIEYINIYIEVLNATPDVNQYAMVDLQNCKQEYELSEKFNLSTYLSACKKLLGNIGELEINEMMNQLLL